MKDEVKLEKAPLLSMEEATQRLGFSTLRHQQQTVLDEVFKGNSVLGILPTSAGKSAIFQLPAMTREGLVIVISPLVALMQDQVDRSRKRGINASALHSHLSVVQKKKIESEILDGTTRLLYLSPERMSGLSSRFFDKVLIQAYAIDEAHCISEWGHDFRPAYLRLGRNLSRFPKAQIVALTATANDKVAAEIQKILGIQTVYRWSPDRTNITYGVAGERVSLIRLVQGVGVPCIVYGSTRASVEDADAQLVRAGYRSGHYHAGMTKEDRSAVHERFHNGEIEVLAATCAFGMGIDHPGIRSVVHLEMPSSLEAYIQETGRAGRDGRPARAVCRATLDTLEVAKSMVPMTWPTPKRLGTFLERFDELIASHGSADGWLKENRVQMSNEDIGQKVGMEPVQVDNAIRILCDEGVLKRTAYRDRPVSVTLLDPAWKLKGSRQKKVIDALVENADENDQVTGSVRFFSEIGMDKSFAEDLVEKGALRIQWVDRCQVIERLEKGFADVNVERIVSIRKRAMDRVDAAKGFLFFGECRRKYLLAYFGAEIDPSDGECCDLCMRKKRALSQSQKP